MMKGTKLQGYWRFWILRVTLSCTVAISEHVQMTNHCSVMTFCAEIHNFVLEEGLVAGMEVAWSYDGIGRPQITQYNTEQEQKDAELEWLCRVSENCAKARC
jgi:hypothetical protein